MDNDIPFEQLLSTICPPTADPDFIPSLFKVRFFNVTDTTSHTLSASSSSTTDLTILISQTQTLRRILPIQIKVAYNSVLFSESRIIDMLDQLDLLLLTVSNLSTIEIGKISLVTETARIKLPDPTANLHWDSFHGAITDIFHINSLQFPTRTCIVESRSSEIRKFSYLDIDNASNVVAHALIRGGIEREDVVVLYSYRGVDLVVAVMGVLKAGATFSVIGIKKEWVDFVSFSFMLTIDIIEYSL